MRDLSENVVSNDHLENCVVDNHPETCDMDDPSENNGMNDPLGNCDWNKLLGPRDMDEASQYSDMDEDSCCDWRSRSEWYYCASCNPSCLKFATYTRPARDPSLAETYTTRGKIRPPRPSRVLPEWPFFYHIRWYEWMPGQWPFQWWWRLPYPDPDFGMNKDFRSPSVPNKRLRERKAKYYSYRAVHPSWVGQKYYDLQLVSSTVHTVRAKPKTLRHKTPSYHVTHVTEENIPSALEKFLRSHHFSFVIFWHRSLSAEIPIAISQAKTADVNSYPIVIPQSPATLHEDNSSSPTDRNDPRSLERIPIPPFDPLPPNTPDNIHYKLRVKTWTKQDNFTMKDHFTTSGADRRHHRGKRRVREKHLQKWNEKDLGRRLKQRSKRLRDEIEGIPNGGYHYHMLGFYFYGQEREDGYYEKWDYEFDTIYWDWDDDFIGSAWRDIDGCAWDEDEHYGDHWTLRIDEVGVLHKVLDWRELGCDYEGMAEYEDETVSVDSEVVVLERDVDDDEDAMSDLAELLVQTEWDVLSRVASASSGESQGFVKV